MAIARDPRDGSNGAAPATGFTLVEVLVMLAVIAVAIGLVTLTLGPDPAAQMRHEADRLRGALEHAAQVAQWRRADVLWQADNGGYRFLRPAADGKWEEETDEILAAHRLPAGAQLRAIGPAGDAIAPLARLRASGRNDPYTVVLASPASSWTIRADPLNRVFAALTQ